VPQQENCYALCRRIVSAFCIQGTLAHLPSNELLLVCRQSEELVRISSVHVGHWSLCKNLVLQFTERLWWFQRDIKTCRSS